MEESSQLLLVDRCTVYVSVPHFEGLVHSNLVTEIVLITFDIGMEPLCILPFFELVEGFSMLTVFCLKSIDVEWPFITNLPTSLLILSIDRMSNDDTQSLISAEFDGEIGTWNTLDVFDQFVHLQQLTLLFAPLSLEMHVEGDLHLPKLQHLALKLHRQYEADKKDVSDARQCVFPDLTLEKVPESCNCVLTEVFTPLLT